MYTEFTFSSHVCFNTKLHEIIFPFLVYSLIKKNVNVKLLIFSSHLFPVSLSNKKYILLDVSKLHVCIQHIHNHAIPLSKVHSKNVKTTSPTFFHIQLRNTQNIFWKKNTMTTELNESAIVALSRLIHFSTFRCKQTKG